LLRLHRDVWKRALTTGLLLSDLISTARCIYACP
jgi:hypothetical protein